MADQTLPLNVSDEMKLDDERQNCVGMESNEELCSSSSDSAEELYSSSATDACGDGVSANEESLSLSRLVIIRGRLGELRYPDVRELYYGKD